MTNKNKASKIGNIVWRFYQWMKFERIEDWISFWLLSPSFVAFVYIYGSFFFVPPYIIKNIEIIYFTFLIMSIVIGVVLISNN